MSSRCFLKISNAASPPKAWYTRYPSFVSMRVVTSAKICSSSTKSTVLPPEENGTSRTGISCSAKARERGRKTENVEPLPLSVCTSMKPPWLRVIP